MPSDQIAFVVVHCDYDIYDIEGIFTSKEAAVHALEEGGFRIYKRGRKKGLWSKRGWLWGLEIDEYQMGVLREYD